MEEESVALNEIALVLLPDNKFELCPTGLFRKVLGKSILREASVVFRKRFVKRIQGSF